MLSKEAKMSERERSITGPTELCVKVSASPIFPAYTTIHFKLAGWNYDAEMIMAKIEDSS